MLRAIGYPYSKLEKMGIWMPVIGVACDYKSPAMFDEVVLIRTWVDKVKGASVYLAYEVVGKESGEVKVTGSSSHGVTDTDLRPLRLKKEFPDLYEKLVNAMK